MLLSNRKKTEGNIRNFKSKRKAYNKHVVCKCQVIKRKKNRQAFFPIVVRRTKMFGFGGIVHVCPYFIAPATLRICWLHYFWRHTFVYLENSCYLLFNCVTLNCVTSTHLKNLTTHIIESKINKILHKHPH